MLRQPLDALIPASEIDTQNHSQVRHPVRVRVTGPAFFDGSHATIGGHGHGNDAPGGDGELPPVRALAAAP